MKSWTLLCATAFVFCIAATSQAGSIVSLDGSAYTSVSASSFINSHLNNDYQPSNLFNSSNPIVGQEMQGPFTNDPGHAWAGDLGPHSHYVEFELDQSYSIESIFYAQRDYNNLHNPNTDKVTSISIWTGSSPFAPADPGTSPDATVSITHQTDDTFLEYALPNIISGQYFLMHVSNPNYTAPNNANGVIGGSELRLGAVPEPSSLALVAIAVLGIFGCRRK